MGSIGRIHNFWASTSNHFSNGVKSAPPEVCTTLFYLVFSMPFFEYIKSFALVNHFV